MLFGCSSCHAGSVFACVCVLLLLCLNLVLVVVVVAYIKWNGREYVLVVFNLVVILKGI